MPIKRSVVANQAGRPQLAALLQNAEHALNTARPNEALAAAEQALRHDGASPLAHQCRAAALLELGQVEDAAAAYERALALSPQSLPILLGAAELFITRYGDERSHLERGLALATRGRKLAERSPGGDPELQFELLLLAGIALNQLGECERALTSLERAQKLVPTSLEAGLERALALFELCRLEAAERELRRIVELDPREPWAHHYLGLLAERRGDQREARKLFARAQQLLPDEFPPPVRLSDEAFDAALEAALRQLPEHVKRYLDDVSIAVEDIPAAEDLVSSSPPLSPCILGVFRGTPVGERSAGAGEEPFPASIVLYQKNLERFARTREELIEQIGITVMHEVGHLIGLDEEDLWERGLE